MKNYNFQPPQPNYIPPQCSICMEDLTLDMIATKCGHVFHSMCIFNNLEYRNECPNCKSRIQKPQLVPLNIEISVRKSEIFEKMADMYRNMSENSDFIELAQKNINLEEIKKELQKTIDSLQLSDKKNKEIIWNNNNEIDKLKRENTILQSKATNLQYKYNDLEVQVKEVEKNYQSIQEQFTQQQLEMIELRSLKEIKNAIEKNEKSEKDYWEYINKQTPIDQLNLLKKALFMKDSKLKSLDQQNMNINSLAEQQRRLINRLESDKQNLEDEIKPLKDKLAKLKTKYENLINERKQQINENSQGQIVKMLNLLGFDEFSMSNSNIFMHDQMFKQNPQQQIINFSFNKNVTINNNIIKDKKINKVPVNIATILRQNDRNNTQQQGKKDPFKEYFQKK